MTYTLVGESSLIDKEIEEILNKEKNISVIKYNLEEISVLSVLEDLNTLSLLEDKKVIIVTNLNKLDKEEELIKYLNHQNSNILILTENVKLDERKKVTKELRKNSNYLEVDNNDLANYIKASFKDYEISNLNISLLKDYCNNDFNRLKQEIEKLKMYKLDDRVITSEDIRLVIKKGLDKNIFDLLNAINHKKTKQMYSVYYELLNNNEDEIKIMSILANNFKLIYKIKVLTKSNNDEECKKQLGIHPYRFKILKEQSYSYSEQELLKLIKALSKLDIDIKSGNLDKKTGLELFLARL